MADFPIKPKYLSERTAGTQVINIANTHADRAVARFIQELTGRTTGTNDAGWLTGDLSFKINNERYTFQNSLRGEMVYNLNDIVDAFLYAGYTPEQIDKAMLNSGVEKGILPQDRDAFSKAINSGSISKYLSQYTNPEIGKIADRLNEQNPDLNAYVKTTLNPDGKTYTYTLIYTDNGKEYEHTVDPDEIGIDKQGKIPEEKFNTWLRNENLESYFTAGANIEANNDAASEFVAEFNKKLKENPNLGTSARSDYNLTDEDIASITANLPDTNNLKAWNLGKDANIYNTLINNLQKNNPQLLERMSLTERQGLADIVSGAQQSVTERNIDTRQATALNNIVRDPGLYEAVTKQFRADNAAGTIAGQRAANAQAIAGEAETAYDKQASDLYASLFGGDKGNVAQQTYEDVFGGKTSALNSSVQGAIDDAIEAQRQGAISLQEYNTILQGLATAAGVDASTFANAVSERQAVASDKAKDLSTELQGDIKSAMAADDADLSYVQGLVNDATKHLNLASDGSADVTNPLTALIEAVAKSPQKYNYTKVSAGDYENAKQFNNQHYQDIVNSDFVKNLLADETIDSLTKAKTIEEFTNDIAKNIGIDALSAEGLKGLYEGYNRDATQQSNKIFNQAQRAYIAAITAGDAKTAEQLIKMANNANASKGNLYAASALANQFKQQTGALNSGRQLATDFLNQRDTNTANVGKATQAAGDAWDSFLGNGTDGYDKSTIYGAFNKHLENAAYGKDMYGKFANSVMDTTQKLNDTSVINNIDNWNRLSQMSSEYTSANAATAANKTLNQSTKDNLTVAAESLDRVANPDKYAKPGTKPKS